MSEPGTGDEFPPAESDSDAAMPVATPVRFCGRCGAVWQLDWIDCAACTPAATGVASLTALASQQIASPAPSVRGAIALYFALLATSLVSIVAMMAEAEELYVELVGTAVFSFVVVVWCMTSGRGTLVSMFRPAAPIWFLIAIAGALATCTIAFGVIESFHRILGLEKLRYIDTYLAAGYGIWLPVVVICVQPAIFEELAFRGVVLSSLRTALTDNEAIIVSAMLFMSIHLSVPAFPHTFAMGIAAGILRVRTGSLLPCMLLHFIHNGIVIVSETYGY